MGQENINNDKNGGLKLPPDTLEQIKKLGHKIREAAEEQGLDFDSDGIDVIIDDGGISDVEDVEDECIGCDENKPEAQSSSESEDGKQRKRRKKDKVKVNNYNISVVEFAILNSFFYSCYIQEILGIRTESYGQVDANTSAVYFGGSFTHANPWWFKIFCEGFERGLIVQTIMFKDSWGQTNYRLSLSVDEGMTYNDFEKLFNNLKKIAFNQSEYKGKCLKVKIHEGCFRGIEILDSSNFNKELILNDIQSKFIRHYINRLKRNSVVRYLLNGEPGTGKAQPLTAKILTPAGWKLMGDIKVGDEVITPSGAISKVTGVYPQGEKDIHGIKFKDGKYTEACDEHLWKVCERIGRQDYKILNTSSIKKQLGIKRNTLKVPLVNDCININSDTNCFIPPYIMGCLLGDGSFNINSLKMSTSDDEIKENITKLLSEKYNLAYDSGYDYLITRTEGKGYKGGEMGNEYVQEVRKLFLSDKRSTTKFIPDLYKNGSLKQKYGLLQGLFDTDGTVDKCGHVSYSTSSYELAKDIQELLWSIGGICKITKKYPTYTYKGEKKKGKLSYNLNVRISNQKDLFRLTRKSERISEKYQYKNSLKNQIVSTDYIGKKEAQCIMIDHPEHLYVTDDYIVTHNTETIRQIMFELLPDVTFVIPDFEDVHDLVEILESCEIFDPSVIVLDDIDLYLGSREKGNYTRLLGQFLSFFDGVKKRKISLLASTNDKGLVDRAAERPGRFNLILDFGFLEDDQIEAVSKMYLPEECQIPEIYNALKGRDANGKQIKVTGAFIANLAENLIEMKEDEPDWGLQDTICLIKESYAGFYNSQVNKKTNGIKFQTED